MTKKQITEQILNKQSYLCIGLDSDIAKIPDFFRKFNDPVFEFNKVIINATHDLCIAYKPNTAFYECNGEKGWKSLKKTIAYIKSNHPELFVIADAKRGDIGNTSKMYAKAFFNDLNADAVTVAPYMGSDSVEPFLDYVDKWVILLLLTSNKGAYDFQFLKLNNGLELYKEVIKKSNSWIRNNNLMYVTGATRVNELREIRSLIPNHFLLIPGIGAQGGNLVDISEVTLTNNCGIIVNASRSILFPDGINNDGNLSREKAKELQTQMKSILSKNKLI